MRDLDTRRQVLNAIIFGRLHHLDLPAHVVSWHIVWLWHAKRIDIVPSGAITERHPTPETRDRRGVRQT